MGLSGALLIGKSGLTSSQVGIEVTGHNLANAATPGFHRQSVHLGEARSQQIQQGIFVGRGVKVLEITRQIDEALENRIRGGISDQAGAAADVETLGQIESVLNELSGVDISSELSAFFNAWNEVADKPEQDSLKQTLIQQAGTLSLRIRGINDELGNLRDQVDAQVDESTRALDKLFDSFAQVDQLVVATEKGGGGANGLRDQRDQILQEISEFVDVSAVEQSNGSFDLYVGSTGVVLAGENRGVEIRRRTVEGVLEVDVVTKDNATVLHASSGRLGALVAGRDEHVDGAVKALDDFVGELIYQVNRQHSQGQSSVGYTNVTGTYAVNDVDAALNSNEAELDFAPGHGSFEVLLRQRSTGDILRKRISVDLDSVDTANNTTLTSLAAQLNGVSNLNASVTNDKRLNITTESGDYELFFANDTSGALASLGINTFFEGSSGLDINVRSDLSPDRVADEIKLGEEGYTTNGNAISIGNLRSKGLSTASGLSLTDLWNRQVEDYGVRLGEAKGRVEAETIVLDNLNAQQQSVSGVNTDEETINLLQFQRAYQASARFVSVVDELFQTLLGLI